MWSANLDKFNIENDSFVLYVTYFSENDKNQKIITFPKSTSSTAIYRRIQSDLDALNNSDTVPAEITLGPFTPIIIQTPPPPPPTDDQKRTAAYSLAVVARSTVVQIVSLGALDLNDPLVASSTNLIKSGFALVKNVIASQVEMAQAAVDGAPQPKP